jgi:hypothetical protein
VNAADVLGMADKGMNNATELRLVTPYKITQVRIAMGRAATPASARNIERACKTFNSDVGSQRVHNEIMIGDLMRWGAARGCSTKKMYIDLASSKFRIEVCRGLVNFLYRARGQG